MSAANRANWQWFVQLDLCSGLGSRSMSNSVLIQFFSFKLYAHINLSQKLTTIVDTQTIDSMKQKHEG